MAAGEGRRMGTPKALLGHPSGESFVAAAAQILTAAGCAPVLAVLGAQAEAAAQTLTDARVVINNDWREGMSTSLRAGLRALAGEGVDAAVIHLVDLPDVSASVVQRIIEQGTGSDLRSALARATYAGRPGHPVLIGANHFDGVLASLDGDAGARGYLGENPTLEVEVKDLATGRDIDTPEERLEFEAEHPA